MKTAKPTHCMCPYCDAKLEMDNKVGYMPSIPTHKPFKMKPGTPPPSEKFGHCYGSCMALYLIDGEWKT